MRAIAFVVMAAALAGCAGGSGGRAYVSPGAYPERSEEIVHEWMRYALKDPTSATDLRISRPSQGQLWRGAIGGGYLDAWVVCVGLNAKNSYGGYTGYSERALYIRDRAVVSVVDLPDRGGWNKFTCSWPRGGK